MHRLLSDFGWIDAWLKKCRIRELFPGICTVVDFEFSISFATILTL
jgi:hypothetical protein